MAVVMMIRACVLDIKHSGGGQTATLRVALSLLFFLSQCSLKWVRRANEQGTSDNDPRLSTLYSSLPPHVLIRLVSRLVRGNDGARWRVRLVHGFDTHRGIDQFTRGRYLDPDLHLFGLPKTERCGRRAVSRIPYPWALFTPVLLYMCFIMHCGKEITLKAIF
jgi:hypothetical protein